MPANGPMPPAKNHTDASDPHHAPLEAALRLAPPAGQLSAPVLEHGSMLLKLYRPRGEDAQVPHTRDELYFVASGTGWFVNGAHRHRFAPGDALFVPAGEQHRFEDFSGDFAVWVVFYGPEGGEAKP